MQAGVATACGIAAVLWCVVSPASRRDDVASILTYHRFGSVVTDTMTIRTATFRRQLADLEAQGHVVVPLRAVLSYLQGVAPRPPPRAVVITVDDGHRSVFTEMLPIVREYNVPVTLFIYPSAISNASYAMTWHELEMLQRTGLFDIQSHSYWHPNFKTEKRRRAAADYRAFASWQLVHARAVLNAQLGSHADLIAWPFGIYDDELIGLARDAGYVAGFTLEGRCVASDDDVMALPRFLVTESASGKALHGDAGSGPCRTKRHANADCLRPLRHRVSRDAVRYDDVYRRRPDARRHGALAAWLPAPRAASLDPARVLREA